MLWNFCYGSYECNIICTSDHLPIGEGLIDHQKAVNALKDMGYDKTITLEVFTNSSNDAKSSADKLRTIWSAYELIIHKHVLG
jgi:sugar phosphate isomerase/epimerase